VYDLFSKLHHALRAAGCLLLLAAAARSESLTPAWIELGERGTVIARVVISDSNCPSIQIDGQAKSMALRVPVPAGFQAACEVTIPAKTKTAKILGQSLLLPQHTANRILVMGDTGCRIKGARVQECNDSNLWPFENVAKQAAAERPDLVVHVGDYLYREDVCPPASQDKCGGTPSGDRWETWNADFFAPAAELLRASPWAFARGNHEDCNRAWRGWFYYLDPRPWKGESCLEFTPPYTLSRTNPAIQIFDSSAASEDAMSDHRVDAFARQLSSLGGTHAWLVLHHPIWGLRVTADQPTTPIPVSEGLQKAWTRASPKGIDTILSGHTHLFELLTFGGLPTQLVAGIGGTQLAARMPAQFDGIKVGNTTVMAGQSKVEFGYALLQRNKGAWDLTLKNAKGEVLTDCSLSRRNASCGSSLHPSAVHSFR
jgi:hypothetical protein